MVFERIMRQDAPHPGALPAVRIAIVGAGPSGLATAIALMKRLHRPFEAWLIDDEDAPGAFGAGPAGRAFTTEPARDLSVVADRPDDFAEWLKGTLLADGSIAALHGPQDLHVPRALFRDYVIARFAEALSLRRDVRIRTFRGLVRSIGVETTGLRVNFQEGESTVFDHVFVATGFGTMQRESESWRTAQAAEVRLAGLEDPPPLTLVGNGPRLAAILLDLRANGYAGEIHVAAATGRLPPPHGRGHDRMALGTPPASRSLRDAFHYIRRECTAAEAQESGQWQSVVDAASVRLSVVWRNLPQRERNHYRRHLLRLHRHFSVRVARDVHRRLAAEFETGRTRFVPPCDPKSADENTIDCREVPSARALGALLGLNPDMLAVGDCGGLLDQGKPIRGLSVIGAIASSLRPGPFVFAETVRQAYRAVLEIQPNGLAKVSQS